ncbi:MAG TPA: trehalose-6-phosphate synthase [Gaiellaceae bacterium]|nr:trehalose-6-phosphate synthase [Gaiellaceae bacterium]
MARRKLIVVSNRGPVSFGLDDRGRRVARRGGGGLATALRGLAARHDVTWVASAMSDEDRAVAAEHAGEAIEQEAAGGPPFRLRLVACDAEAYDRYYNVVSNGTLWFLQHYLWGLAVEPDVGAAFRAAWTEGYERVNRVFADAVVDELDREPGAAVCFHDYHLYLAPAYVRDVRPSARLTHFVHVPWAQPDYWHVLPADVRRALHHGLCANDVVGFHTERWRRNFELCCEWLGAPGTRTVVNPIGVDAHELDALADDPLVLEEERRIASARPELLVVRVDRTELSKNIVRGFRAFALLLERHPELAGRVGMLALLDPSRQDLPVYGEYLRAAEEEARAVNERFGAGAWRPVDLQVADNFPQAIAAYKQFDVLLVNPIFDGMNLVAKEAPLVNRRDGVVVLSENAGAHEELGEWTLGVNPFDVEEQAAALYDGLTMPAPERRRRAVAIRAHVRRRDIAAWTDGQLAELDRPASTIRS